MYILHALLLSNSMWLSPSREAHYYIKFPEFYGIRIQTEELANCKHPGPSSPNPRFPQSPLMIYCTFVLPLTPSPSNWSSFNSVSSPKLCMHFLQTPVRISPFAYLVVLDVVILISCRQNESCGFSPWNLFQSPAISSLVGPISSPAPHSYMYICL